MVYLSGLFKGIGESAKEVGVVETMNWSGLRPVIHRSLILNSQFLILNWHLKWIALAGQLKFSPADLFAIFEYFFQCVKGGRVVFAPDARFFIFQI